MHPTYLRTLSGAIGLAALIATGLVGISTAGMQFRESKSVLTVPSPTSVIPSLATVQTLTRQEIDFAKSNAVLRVATVSTRISPPLQFEGDSVSRHSEEFLRYVANAVGYELVWQEYDSVEASLEAIKLGKADISPSVTVTALRQTYLDFTAGVSSNPIGLAGLRSSGEFKEKTQLSSLKIAVLPDQYSHDYLATHYPKATFIPVDSLQQAVRSLDNGDVDYYIGRLPDDQPEQNHTLPAGADSITRVEMKQRFYFRSNWNRIAVRSDWPLLVSIINKHLLNPQLTINRELAAALQSSSRRQSTSPLELSRDDRRLLSSLGVLRVGMPTSIPLISGTGQDGGQIGAAAAITAELSYSLGLPILLKRYPSGKVMMEAMQAGAIDVIPYIPIRDNDNLLPPTVYSDPYMDLPWTLVSRESFYFRSLGYESCR